MKGGKRTLTADLSGINAGARVAADQWSAEVRAENQALTWRYINTRYLTEDAAQLADMLGLTPTTTRQPGHCACGVVLPMSSLTATKAGYRPGKCRRCLAGQEVPQFAPTHRRTVSHKIPQPPPDGVSRCNACDREYRLTGTGRLRRHPAWETRDGARFRLPWDCGGSGLRPEDVEAA